jgi:uncharacterized protein
MKFSLKARLYIAFFTLVLAGSVLGYFMRDRGPVSRDGQPAILDWAKLEKLNYQTGDAPGWLKNLDGQIVRVPGFIVPLEDSFTEASEFLLVPDPGACIHVPPPPPNQMVYVKMKSGHPVEINGQPIWITGRLKIDKVESPYGQVSYSMEGDEGEVFRSFDQFEKEKPKGGS